MLAVATLSSAPAGADGRIDRLFAAYDRPNVPGASVLVLKDGEVAYSKAYGLAELESRRTATPATNYRIASLTKQFTAMAIMILVERGLVAESDAMTQHIPEFPAYGRRITVKHLLQHTSGLKDYEPLVPPQQRVPLKDRDVVQLLARQSATDFTPGTRYRYSNSGYATLAVIVERVTGQRFSEFLAEAIFAPLGMTETVAYEDGLNEVPERAYGYSPAGSGFQRTDQSMTSAVLGDGGIYTSVVDWVRWDEALRSERLVSAATLARMLTPGRLPDGSSTGYGYGWKLDTWRGYARHSHTGSTIGFRTAMQRIPARNLTVVVLVNRANATPWDLADQIAALYL